MLAGAILDTVVPKIYRTIENMMCSSSAHNTVQSKNTMALTESGNMVVNENLKQALQITTQNGTKPIM